MPDPVPLSSRVRGALYGLAVCDALGGPVEFKPRGSFKPVTRMLPNDNFDLPPGCFTDDTSMTLCLAQSFLDCGGQSNIVDQVKKYISWWRDGYLSSVGRCFDIGVSTKCALETWDNLLRLDHDASPTDEAHRAILKRITRSFGKDEFCGNGSLMRVLPAALIAVSELDAVQLARESSLPTHPHPRCVHACMIYAALVLQTLNGASKTELALSLAESVKEIPSNVSDTPIEPVLAERLGKYQTLEDWEKTPAESIRSTGYVVDTLEASLWAFFNSDTFDEAATLAVNLGYDADTVGAICGGLAGAYHGFEAIPESWLRDMKKTDLLDEVAQKILEHRNTTV
ncbi:uncharacterized protein A1O5_07940 [Cladophialophora psammophila CBS 110553]|uniref:ADP-ribosylhydrolase ARH3 n=1 Tax=Cladophialophora psammophila CBS 110553 TaxID=1182543 RepID=W9WVC8_9EURO|nr:uncharacterized protein A1O5_07940 [Cladophialophora psammophila CBS 110553]EXJ69005.1 hypothetical protein A1O5_07940 [Cladophialophora psammophila CBS 110553]